MLVKSGYDLRSATKVDVPVNTKVFKVVPEKGHSDREIAVIWGFNGDGIQVTVFEMWAFIEKDTKKKRTGIARRYSTLQEWHDWKDAKKRFDAWVDLLKAATRKK